MQAGIPILCATDTYTDVGKIAEKNGYGLSCESNNEESFVEKVSEFCDENMRSIMGKNANSYLNSNYTVEKSYEIIMKRVGENGK